MGKRGFSLISENILLVLAIVIIALFAIFAKDFKQTVEASSAKQECLESVRQNAFAHIRGLTIPTRINCPTENIDIDDKEPEVIKGRIARAMYDCWWQFGEGKYNLFKDEITYCSVCSLIEFDTENSKPVKGLFPYLVDNPIPDSSGRTYIDYLMGYQTPKAQQVIGEGANPKLIRELEAAKNEALNPDAEYAVIFVYSKGKDNLEKILNHISLSTTEAKLGAITGVALGGATAVSTWTGLSGLAIIGLAGGPIGWIALGTGALVAATAYGTSYYFSSDNWPEWASFVVLREWSADELKLLGCEEAP